MSIALLLPLLLSTPSSAQEEVEFAEIKEAEEEPLTEPETNVSVEVGGVVAAGNVEYQTAQGRAVASHRWTENGVAANLTGNIGRSIVDGDEDGLLSDAERDLGFQETARRLNFEARYDRFFGKRSSVYVLGGALLDPFSGYDLRTHEQVGYSRRFIDKEKFKLISELGIDYAQENYVDGVEPNYQGILAARAFVGIVANITDDFAVTNDLEVYENLLQPADVRVLETLAVTTRITDVFTFKTSYALVFDNVPVEGFRPLDQVAMVTLVVSIL